MKAILLQCVMLFLYVNLFAQNTTKIAKDAINSTVSIVTLDKNSQPFAFGSGFIIGDELIATNVHVIEGCNSVYVLKNGEETKYTVAGYVAIDKVNDLVILKVSKLYGAKLPLDTGAMPDIGSRIYAVGNPKGLTGTFSEGIISGNRVLQTNQVLQITAPISPGSSGGPVINVSGQVVGISFASYTNGQNLNFAIPVKYLIALDKKIGVIQPISYVKKPTPKTASSTKNPNTINPSIKEGVTVRNIRLEGQYACFSIKNNLPYKISDIRILILVYDKTGTVIDYNEKTYFLHEHDEWIAPYLAKTIGFPNYTPPQVTYGGYKAKGRVLDYKIIEE